MQTLAQVAAEINEVTGHVGPELEWRTHFIAMMTAQALGDIKAADHFQARMREAFARCRPAGGPVYSRRAHHAAAAFKS